MKRKPYNDSASGYNWMDTYGDMITLLLTFFVLLYSMSNVDSEKWKKLVSALTGADPKIEEIAPPANYSFSSTDSELANESYDQSGKIEEVIDFDDLYGYLKQYVEENDLSSDVALFKGEGYTFITFNNNVFFDGDKSVLRPEAKNILDFFAGALTNITDQIGEIRAYGHTARGGSAETPNRLVEDRTLSVMRANNVIIYLQIKNIVEAKKMVAEGYGEHRPIIPHDGTEATRIKNRRVEIYISKTDKANMTLENIYAEIYEEKNNL